MKQLSTVLADELMEGLDILVANSEERDRSYFVRQAIREYLERELPKAAKRKKPDDLKDLLRTAQKAAPDEEPKA
jgi:metal-responsive CopG/Arc/MetJ family transcriptional regulator